ncbi:hypothetical protein IAR55_006330 [Kwoniella newhampshirensis]|uniref:Major facilitator superfamily (MFS) profile domain-containing protein n=1 Tax=Kwoniella newhampshirensis TaxID=1651941 RepID=A0AAW0YG89_9TREE
MSNENQTSEPRQSSTNRDVEKQTVPAPPTFPEGSLQGWLTVVGAWLVIFVSFGYTNAFGVFQAYYAGGYPEESAMNISWIGSIQLFLQYILGALVGPLYEKGYFHHLMVSGSVLYIVCIFMTSLATRFWQTILAQGIGIGIGIGGVYLPALSVATHYFQHRRALALGIVVTGSSIGGICLPIMLNNLIAKHGFKLAVQYTGYLLMGCLIVANCLMRTRLPPKHVSALKPSPKDMFSSVPYCFLVAGLFLCAWGIFFPFYYVQDLGNARGISPNITFYSLAFMNAGSVFGRITPNFLADNSGCLNLLTIMSTVAGIMSFAFFGATNAAGLIIVGILYGFFSGAFISLMAPALISFARDFHEIGLRTGMGLLVMSFAVLTGTPITGALLDKYGFYAPITWSGVTILSGCVCFAISTVLRRREKSTWKV